MKKIPEKSLEQEFQDVVKKTCLSLAEVCYQRIMRNPEQGLRYLSELATLLDCKLNIDLKLDGGPE